MFSLAAATTEGAASHTRFTEQQRGCTTRIGLSRGFGEHVRGSCKALLKGVGIAWRTDVITIDAWAEMQLYYLQSLRQAVQAISSKTASGVWGRTPLFTSSREGVFSETGLPSSLILGNRAYGVKCSRKLEASTANSSLDQ
jgi:hypothetical protein